MNKKRIRHGLSIWINNNSNIHKMHKDNNKRRGGLLLHQFVQAGKLGAGSGQERNAKFSKASRWGRIKYIT